MLQGVWHQWIQRCSCPSQPSYIFCISHSTQTYLWSCTGSQFIVLLFFKIWRFISYSCGLIFLIFFSFLRWVTVPSDLVLHDTLVPWRWPLVTRPQEGSGLVNLQLKSLSYCPKEVGNIRRTKEGTKPVSTNLLQIGLPWFLTNGCEGVPRTQKVTNKGPTSNVLISTGWPHLESCLGPSESV